MSRCKACDVVLNEEELVRQWPPTEDGHVDFVDLCTSCYCAALEIEDVYFPDEVIEDLASYGIEE
jgi:hypothetical protein